VKVSVEEYKDMLDRKKEIAKPGNDEEGILAAGKKGTGELPLIVSLAVESEQAEAKDE
jgi:hypothetical protein